MFFLITLFAPTYHHTALLGCCCGLVFAPLKRCEGKVDYICIYMIIFILMQVEKCL